MMMKKKKKTRQNLRVHLHRYILECAVLLEHDAEIEFCCHVALLSRQLKPTHSLSLVESLSVDLILSISAVVCASAHRLLGTALVVQVAQIELRVCEPLRRCCMVPSRRVSIALKHSTALK